MPPLAGKGLRTARPARMVPATRNPDGFPHPGFGVLRPWLDLGRISTNIPALDHEPYPYWRPLPTLTSQTKSMHAYGLETAMPVVLTHASALKALQHLAAQRNAPTTRSAIPTLAAGPVPKPRLSEVAGIDRTTLGIGARLHCAVPTRADVIRIKGITSNVITGALPDGALLNVAPGLYCVHPAIIAAQLAPDLDRIERIVLLYELCGRYATSVNGPDGYAEIESLTTVRNLEKMCARLVGIRGISLVRNALRFVADNAASPAEAEMALRFGLPRRMGGYGFGIPRLNDTIPVMGMRYEGGRPVQAERPRQPDLLWLALGVALDYHGERSHRSFRQIDRDLRRSNELQTSEVTCFTLTRHQARDCLATDKLAFQMQKTAYGRLRPYKPEFNDARLDLATRLLQIQRSNWQRLE